MLPLIGSPPDDIRARFTRTELGRAIGFAPGRAIGGPVGPALRPQRRRLPTCAARA